MNVCKFITYLEILTAYENEGPSRQNSLISQPQSEPLENSLPSATDRRRSLINDRPKTSTTTILRSYSSSSFESPDDDEDQDSDWDESESVTDKASTEESTLVLENSPNLWQK